MALFLERFRQHLKGIRSDFAQICPPYLKGEFMGWLDEIERFYIFRCKECEAETAMDGVGISVEEAEEKMSKIKCLNPDCAKEGTMRYAGFGNYGAPIGVARGVLKETFEQNGRKAYKIGNTYMSKTKYNYMDTGKIHHEYTPSYREELEKDREKNKHLLERAENKRRAMVKRYVEKSKKKPNSKTL